MKGYTMNPRNALLLTLFALIVTGCRTEQTSSPTPGNNITLSIARTPSAPTSPPLGELEISSAKILLKNVKLHQSPSDDGRDITAGPLAVALALDGSLNTIGLTQIPPGLYDRVKFRLHKPEDTEPIPDPEFRDGASGQLRYSTIVRGSYNGQPFVYKSRQDAAQEVRFASPLSVTKDEIVNVTLTVDIASWFAVGGVTLDPANPNNAQAIDEAIRASFARVFKDNDRDGRPDDR